MNFILQGSENRRQAADGKQKAQKKAVHYTSNLIREIFLWPLTGGRGGDPALPPQINSL
jgi:hypothetical protein